MREPLSNLTHYLRLACQEAGVNWNGENETELAMIADEIRAIVRSEMAEEFRDLRSRLAVVEQAAAVRDAT